MPAKRVIIDGVVLQALAVLGSDLGKDFQELAEEAFSDLLKKHHRPVGLKAALQQSLRRIPANDGRRQRKSDVVGQAQRRLFPADTQANT